MTLAYDGTRYAGWQVQPDRPTVQAAVEQAVRQLTGVHADVLAAGRTDAGVHALGQVAHFRTASQIPAEKLVAGLQHFLPDDIVILSAADAAPDFHARYHTVSKRYRYIIDTSPVQSPFLKRYAVHIRYGLDVPAMHAAAQCLAGTHDFRCFETDWPNRASSVRTVFEIGVTRAAGWSIWHQAGSLFAPAPAAERPFVCLDVSANGFLYNMVRSIAGTLLEVGRGRWTADDVQRLLEAGDRTQAGATAPPHGLYLMEVVYGP